MRALTVREPWASLIASGEKLVENRSGTTNYRGPLAIHAGLAFSEAGSAFPPSDPRVVELLGRVPTAEDYRTTMGRLLAVVDIVDCHVARQDPGTLPCCQPWGNGEYRADRRTMDAHHLVLANPRRVEPPIAIPGKLGLWRLPPDLTDVLGRIVPPPAGASATLVVPPSGRPTRERKRPVQ